MKTAWELIQTVERAGGHFVVNGDLLGIAPAFAAQAVLKEVRENKREIIKLLQRHSAMRAKTSIDEGWSLWLLERCAYRDRCWGMTGALYLSLASWLVDHQQPVPASRRAFVNALQGEGFQVMSDSLVYGLVLKEDLETRPELAKTAE